MQPLPRGGGRPLSGTWHCFQCLVSDTVSGAHANGLLCSLEQAVDSVIARLLSRPGPSEGDDWTYLPIVAPGRAVLTTPDPARDPHSLRYERLLVDPQGHEDPRHGDETLPATRTSDKRFHWDDIAFHCDCCPSGRIVPRVGEPPPGAFVFRALTADGPGGLPPPAARAGAFFEKEWNAQWQCKFCCAASWCLSLAETDDILFEARAREQQWE